MRLMYSFGLLLFDINALTAQQRKTKNHPLRNLDQVLSYKKSHQFSALVISYDIKCKHYAIFFRFKWNCVMVQRGWKKT